MGHIRTSLQLQLRFALVGRLGLVFVPALLFALFQPFLDTNRDVAVYVKLPDGFYISTPVGKYNPDWAIAFYEGTVKHIYFVAETKGTLDSMKLNHITPVEQAKIDCARAHFKALNDENVVYDVVRDYQTLLNAVMK